MDEVHGVGVDVSVVAVALFALYVHVIFDGCYLCLPHLIKGCLIIGVSTYLEMLLASPRRCSQVVAVGDVSGVVP